MSQNSTELMPPEETAGGQGKGQGFFGRLSTPSKVLFGLLLVVLIIVIVFAAVKTFSSSSNSSPILPPPASPATSQATATTGATVTTFSGAYGNRDPFVPLVAATVTTTASVSTTTTAPSGVVVPTTATTTPSQISLVSVSPLGTAPSAEVTVGSTSYPGLTVGTTFANGAYTVTAINQSTACATFTSGGSSTFQLCTGQAVLK